MKQPPVQLEKLAYSVPSFAAAVDLSIDTIRKHIADGNLIAGYSGSKPIIEREEGLRFLRSLPPAPPSERRAA
jgi:hypothetical protein